MTASASFPPRFGAAAAAAAPGQMRTDPLFRTMLLAIAFFSPWAGVNLGGLTVSAMDVMIPVAFALVVTGHVGRSRLSALYMLFVGLTLVMTIVVTAGFRAGPPIPSVLAALRLAAIFSPFILVFGLSRLDPAFARRLLSWSIAGMFLAVFAGDLLYLAGVRVVETQQNLWVREGAGWRTALRAGGLHGNSGAFGAQAAVLLILFFAARPKLFARGNDLGAILVLGVAALAIAGSSSRGGMVQAAAALIPLMLLGHMRLSPTMLLAGMAGTALVLVGIVAGRIDLQLGDLAVALSRLNFLDFFGTEGFLQSSRMIFFARAAEIISDNWFFGIGYKLTIARFNIVVDNSFLSTFLESGLFTALVFTGFWVALAVRSLWLWRFDALYAPTLFFLLLSMLARMMVTSVHTAWNSAPIMFLVIALFLRLSEERVATLRRMRARPMVEPSTR